MSRDDCPFCLPEAERVFHEGPLTRGLWDGFAVSAGHALLVPKRHVSSWFEASEAEQHELFAGIAIAKREIEAAHQPDGFNVGINVGEAAGQTVPHLHIHVIPRYAGDVKDPRGGVRHVIPAKADYWSGGGANQLADHEPGTYGVPIPPLAIPHGEALVAGGDDPLLPHLKAHLNAATDVDLAVAFMFEAGVRMLEPDLEDLLDRRGRLRVLTGDYLGATQVEALVRLLDLREKWPEQVELRAFNTEGQRSFHPKAYIFRGKAGGGVAFVGSSNLSRTALQDGIEWNYRAVSARDSIGFGAVCRGFDALFGHPGTSELDRDWVDAYAERRGDVQRSDIRREAPADEPPEAPPTPHSVQQRALAALKATREAGNSAGLVVLATGLGKTWLSAFDSAEPEYRRVLFVAHREEILRQSMSTFRQIRPTASLGLYNGSDQVPDAEVVFASVQTLSRQAHLERFAKDAFDYIVVDEFHHAAARTYRRVIDHFEPKFFIGLTATPERTDGGDLLGLCQENLIFRCDLVEGIREGLLSPFHYFGVPDEVDYRQIPWRNARFDPEELTAKLATDARAQNALEQHKKRAGERTLAFCCSQRHADFMKQFFSEAGLRVAAVHSGRLSDPRAGSLEALEAGDLDVVFSVDMLNEGVDLPHVDTVLMLRPTESRILWTQQFGRGLRVAEGKERLTVIDYIGNHRTFLMNPRVLLGLEPGYGALQEALRRAERGELELPPGCEVTYDLQAIEILRALIPQTPDALRYAYEEFRERNDVRPTAVEIHHEGYNPGSLRTSHGSWLGFVKDMGDLDETQREILSGEPPSAFLEALESTEMTRSYKMLVLKAMLVAGCFPGRMALGDLVAGVRRLAGVSAVLSADLGEAAASDDALARMLKRNPINAWTEGRGTGGVHFFEFDGNEFATSFDVAESLREAFQELTRELVDWRLARYLERPSVAAAEDELSPVRAADKGDLLEIGKSIKREQIPGLYGLKFVSTTWQQGYVHQGDRIFLLVTLEKKGLPKEHHYADRFLKRDSFEWQSQNRHTQKGKPGQTMKNQEANGIPVLLYVRKTRRLKGRGAPFIYCGPVAFESWEGDKPITVRWRLQQPLSDRLAALFALTNP